MESAYTATVFGEIFRLMDNTFLYGPIALFRKTTLSWRVLEPDDITPDSVAFLTFFEPKLDLLIIGPGDQRNLDPVRKRLAPFLKENKIPYEILPIEDAISTFNYLNNEGRHICALLYPPDDIKISTADEMTLNQEFGWQLDDTAALFPEVFEPKLKPGQKVLHDEMDVIQEIWRREIGQEDEKEVTPLERQRKSMARLRQKILGTGYSFANEEMHKMQAPDEELKRLKLKEIKEKEEIKKLKE